MNWWESLRSLQARPDSPQKQCMGQWTGTYENAWYCAAFNSQMELTSLVAKDAGNELIKEGRKGNELMTYEDRPMNWDNWDVDMFYQRKPYGPDEVTAPVLKEAGPVRTVISISRRFAAPLWIRTSCSTVTCPALTL